MENKIKLLAFDADDTLWDNQSHFDEVENQYCQILGDYGTPDEISAALFRTESHDMPLLGYGAKAFTISLVENAIEVSKGKVDENDLMKIIELGKSLLKISCPPLPEVEDTVRQLHESKRYTMVVLTKGELLDQENKMNRSGLSRYFDDVVVVSDKTNEAYLKLCQRFNADISEFLMIGNSFKSDIEPVLQLGGWAAHIPFHTMWKYEKTEEHDHDHLIRLSHFAELIDAIENLQ